MAKGKSLEEIEAKMAKLREKHDALRAERHALADERRKLIFAQEAESKAIRHGLTVIPEPAILNAKVGG